MYIGVTCMKAIFKQASPKYLLTISYIVNPKAVWLVEHQLHHKEHGKAVAVSLAKAQLLVYIDAHELDFIF